MRAETTGYESALSLLPPDPLVELKLVARLAWLGLTLCCEVRAPGTPVVESAAPADSR